MDMVAHDLAGPSIGVQVQIHALASCRQVGNVSHPDLLGPGRHPLVRSVLKQIGKAPEAMMALGGLAVGPLCGHQQACCAQHIKQAVTSHLDRGKSQARVQDVVQLTCT